MEAAVQIPCCGLNNGIISHAHSLRDTAHSFYSNRLSTRFNNQSLPQLCCSCGSHLLMQHHTLVIILQTTIQTYIIKTVTPCIWSWISLINLHLEDRGSSNRTKLYLLNLWISEPRLLLQNYSGTQSDTKLESATQTRRPGCLQLEKEIAMACSISPTIFTAAFRSS